MLRFAILAWSILMLGLTAPADAALLQFTVSGSDTLSVETPPPVIFASFQLDSSPTVAPTDIVPGNQFALANVAGTFQYGQTVRTTPQPINFFNANLGGGLAVGLDLFLVFDGPQLYTGTEAMPTFKTGNFTLTNFASRAQIGLTITEVPAAVPEPATWAMMLTGFGLVGGMMRCRRRTTTAAHA